MKPKSVLYIVAFVLVVVFALANWSLLAGAVQLNLLIIRIHAPLGVLMLLIAGVIALVDLGVQALNQRTWTRERRAMKKELDDYHLGAARDEASRSEALRVAMERELAVIRRQLDKLLASHATPTGPSVSAQDVVAPSRRDIAGRPRQ